MKRFAVVLALTVMGFFCLTGISFAQAIENEFYLITPVSKDVTDPALAAFGGVPAVASLGQRIDRVTPAFADRTLALLAGVVADGARIHDLEVSGPARSDDRFRTWLLNAEPLGDAEGERVGIAISVVDITERKNREEAKAALAKLQRQAQAIGESIPFGIWVAEPDGRVSHLSESYLALTGQTMTTDGGVVLR